MATEFPSSHQTTVSDEQMETKVDEVKHTEAETTSQVKGSAEEEKPSSKELPSQSISSENLVVDTEGEQAEPPTVVDKKIDDVPSSEPVSDSANSQTTAEPAEQPVEAAVEKVEEEKLKVVDAPQSSDEAIVKPQEPPVLLPTEESEATVQNDYDDTVIAKEVDRPESVVPAVEEHAHEQSEVANKTEKIESEQVLGLAEDPSGNVSLKSEEAYKLGTEVPKVEVKQEEEAKLKKPEDQSLEANEKVHDPVVVPATDESNSDAAEDTNDTIALPKQIETPQSAVPEAKVKQEEEPNLEKQGEQPLEATEKVDDPVVVLASDESKAAAVPNTNDTVAEAEVKQEEETKFEKPDEQSLEETEKVKDPVTVLDSHESKAAAVQDNDDTVALTKQVEAPQLVTPESAVKQEEEPKFEKQEGQSFEATEKVQDPVVVLASIESKAAALQDTDDTVAPAEQLETPQLVVPEAEVKLEEQSEAHKQVEKQEREILQPEVKPEEHSVIAKEVEEPELAVPEVQVKPEEQYGIVEQVEKKLNDENPEPIKVNEVIDQSTKGETVTEVPALASTVADVESAKGDKIDTEEKTSASVNSEQDATTVQEDQADSKRVQGDIIDKAGAENEKKELNGSDVVQVSSKEATEEKQGNAGEEQESKFIETKEENLEKYTPKEEVVQSIKLEEVKDSASNVEVTERSFEEAKSDSVEPPVEDHTEDNVKAETLASGETIKKLEEAPMEVTETTKETQDLVSDVKTVESAKTIENEEKKEKAEEIAKSDVQNKKDRDESKGTQEQAREMPGKPTQKQSNNIFTKVKQSLVKAKKAITGKSPNPKTVSSDTKDDIKVK